MKGIKYLIIPALILCFILASCSENNKQTETTDLSNAATDEAQNPAEISEKAMENFIAKRQLCYRYRCIPEN